MTVTRPRQEHPDHDQARAGHRGPVEPWVEPGEVVRRSSLGRGGRARRAPRTRPTWPLAALRPMRRRPSIAPSTGRRRPGSQAGTAPMPAPPRPLGASVGAGSASGSGPGLRSRCRGHGGLVGRSRSRGGLRGGRRGGDERGRRGHGRRRGGRRGLGLGAALAERGPWRRERPGTHTPRADGRERRVLGRRCRGGWHVRTRHRGRRGLAGSAQTGGLGGRLVRDRVWRRLVGDGGAGRPGGVRTRRIGRADRRADPARDGRQQRAALRTREAPVRNGLTASGADDRPFGHRSPRQPPRAPGGPIACQTSDAGSSPHSARSRRPRTAPASAARRRSTPRAARRRPRRRGPGRRSRAPRTPRRRRP